MGKKSWLRGSSKQRVSKTELKGTRTLRDSWQLRLCSFLSTSNTTPLFCFCTIFLLLYGTQGFSHSNWLQQRKGLSLGPFFNWKITLQKALETRRSSTLTPSKCFTTMAKFLSPPISTLTVLKCAQLYRLSDQRQICFTHRSLSR